MYNLLINDTSGEFFFKGLPLLTLDNINTINLFIGANNTRKSRLMRRIAQLERKMVLITPANLSQLLNNGSEIIDKLNLKLVDNPDLTLFHFTSNRKAPEPSANFSKLQEFFEKEVAPVIRYSTFVDHLEKIIKTIPVLASQKDMDDLTERIQRFRSLVEMLVYVYALALEGEDIVSKANYGGFNEPNANTIHFNIPDRDHGGVIKDIGEKLEIFREIQLFLAFLSSLKVQWFASKGIYIPVLRSSRNLLDDQSRLIGNNVFATTINLQYFNSITSPHNVTVHTGQEHYTLIDKAKRGKKEQREDFAEFESFIGKSFYQSAEIEIIAYEGGKYPDIIVSLPNERPDIPIYDLGDGVQAIINLFFPIFTAENGTWIFIDEPELNLHPGFQNLFIRTLLENEFLREKQLRYFINSHSNHILSEVLLSGPKQAEVYVFQRRDENSSDIITFEGYENATLDLLGVLNTSTLISNCSVWVEGITDRIYMRAFLNAFLKVKISGFQPIEGLNYAFIEYGGKNLVHYIFDGREQEGYRKNGIDTFFLNRNIFLLADTDTKKEKQHSTYQSLETEHFKYAETGVPEIENLLPPTVLSMFLKKKLRINEDDVSKIFQDSYEQVKLGRFFTKQFGKYNITKKIEAETGGTLSSYYKSALAEFVFQQVQIGEITWEMLMESRNLSEITIRLYEFIAISNNKTDFDTLAPF